MSTSSARPADLDAWVTASRALDEVLRTRKATLDRLHAEFQSTLGWGYFDASSMLAGFDAWLGWNETDARWVTTVAQAFRDAGSGAVADAVIEARLRAAGLDAERMSITYDDPIALGEWPSSGYADDPVNTATGNFLEVEVDLVANGLTRLLRVARTYNSRSDRVGPFGPGWASWATARLRAEPEGAHWEAPDGQRAVIPRGSDGNSSGNSSGNGDGRRDGTAFGRLAGIPGLVVPAGDGLTIEWFGGGRLVFDPAGLPLVADDGPGTQVRFRHDGDRLIELAHAAGKSVFLEWSGDRIVGLRCDDGRSAAYRYDTAGRLIEVDGHAGLRHYEVDDADRVVAVIDADGVVEARSTYDGEGRVTGQVSPHGRRSRFRYLPGRVTIVDDDAGGPTNTYVHDEAGRLTGVVDGHGAELVKLYDRWGNPVAVTERNGATTRLEWNERSRLTRRVRPEGTSFAFTYDDRDRVVEVGASGAVTRFRYEGEERIPAEIVDPQAGVTQLTVEGGVVRRVVDPDGVELGFGFDGHGNLASITDAAGNMAVIERDPAGRVGATVSPTGLRTELVYDRRGRVVERREPGGGAWRYEWTAAGRLSATVDPTGARTEVHHGADGEAGRIVDPLGQATARRFDALGNLVGVVLSDGAKWELGYDGLCRLSSIHDPAGGTWLREYDVTGNLVGTIDPVGVRRHATVDRTGRVTGVDDGLTSVGFDYDELGRATVQRRPDGTQLAATYDRCGRITTTADPLGGVTRYTYTPAGRPDTVTSPLGAVTRFEYDRAGRCVAAVDPLGHRWSYRYDGDGRLTQRVAPTGEIERFRYDDGGRLAARVSPSGGTTAYAYNAAGRLVALTDPAGGVRRLRYDARGQLVEARDANGGATRYERDARGFVSRIVDPLGGVVEQRHDALGRVVARTDQLGRTTTWAFDPAGRLTRRALPTGEAVHWRYDDSGRVHTVDSGTDGPDGEDPHPRIRIDRDLLGRPVVIEEPGFRHELIWDAAGQLAGRRRNGLGLAWRYDADGRRVAIGLPDGSDTTFEHDAAGRVARAAHPALGTVEFERDAAGRLVHASSGHGAERWRYREGALVGHEIERAGRPVAGTELERDATGRVLLSATNRVALRYRYDAAGQLTGVDGPNGSWTYAYDAAGRLVTESGPGGTTTYAHDAAHQLTERRAGDAVTRFAYDAAGRRVSQQGPAGDVRRFRWDWQDRLSGVDDTSLVVDAFGDLAEIDGRPLLWDPVAAVSQLRWNHGTSLAGGDQPWATVDMAGGVGWLDRDWQGSVGNGRDVWGTETNPSHVPAARLGYRGELGVDGLVWLRARAYDPATRAFLSPDPLPAVPGAPGTTYPYHYAGNDPLGAVDPLGLQPLTEAQLAEYREAAGGNVFERAGDWVVDNWEYIAAGALIVGGVLVMATGVGGPIGAAMIGGALLSGGISAGSQRLLTGQVDWRQVGVDMAIGGLAGGTGAAITSTTTVARVATTTVARGMIAGSTEGLVSGAAYQGVNYARTGQFDPAAIARDTLLGGVTGGGGAYVQERAVLGPLQRVAPDTFQSPNTGLVYGPDPNYGNRVNHVLRHTVDDPSRVVHGVFSGDRHVFDVVDDAYVRSNTSTVGVMHEPTSPSGVRGSVITMDDPVGYVGGSGGAAAGNPTSQHVNVVVRNGNQAITAYPTAGIPMGR